MRVSDYAETWLGAKRIRSTTLRRYRATLKNHILPALGERRVCEVSRVDVKAFLIGRRELLSGNTVNVLAGVVSDLFAAAVDDGLIPTNPAHRVGRALGIRREQETPKALTEEQVAALLEAAEPEYRFPLTVFAHLPLRIGEGSGLMWQDYDPGSRTMLVERQLLESGKLAPPKSRRSVRELDVDGTLARLLAEYRRTVPRGVRLILWPKLDRERKASQVVTHRCDLNAAMRRALERAGLPSEHTIHHLRHTWATNQLARGAPLPWVSYQLGHGNATITDGIYGRHRPRRNREASESYALALQAARAQRTFLEESP